MAQKVWQLIPLNQPESPCRLETFPLILGRADECDIPIADDTVSPRHVRLSGSSRKLVIEDLESAHGTLVNDQPVRRATVRSNQKTPTRLQVGHTVFEIYHGEPGTGHLSNARSDAENREEWFYHHDEQEIGPVSLNAITDGLRRGEIRLHDTIRRDGSDASCHLFELRDLLPGLSDPALAASSPPPAQWTAHGTISGLTMRDRLTCPYCWERFEIEDMPAIAAHPDLVGDPILGETDAERFLPQHFTADGLALDAKDMACRENACPNCHMRLPDALLALPPVFFSIFGVPSSGKSYFLTSMCWTLRSILSKQFATSFKDADAAANHWLNEYEERLFLHGDHSVIRQLDKTEMRGRLYREATLNRMNVFLPLPSFFVMQPRPEQESEPMPVRPAGDLLLVVYDNAGEHFQPGQDTELNPGTRHIAHAQQLLFLFDPTRDPRLRSIISGKDFQLRDENLIQRQDVILTEMMDRLRRHLNLEAGERFGKTFVFGVSKADVLAGFIPLKEPPWNWHDSLRANALNLNRIAQVSFLTRTLLNERLPDLIGAVESFAEHVVYLPNSALGHSPESRDSLLQIKTSDIRPQWVEAPLLYLLARAGLIPAVKTVDPNHPLPEEHEYDGRFISFRQPGTDTPLRLPDTFSGYSLQCPRTGAMFRVPDVAPNRALGSPLETALDR